MQYAFKFEQRSSARSVLAVSGSAFPPCQRSCSMKEQEAQEVVVAGRDRNGPFHRIQDSFKIKNPPEGGFLYNFSESVFNLHAVELLNGDRWWHNSFFDFHLHQIAGFFSVFFGSETFESGYRRNMGLVNHRLSV